MRLDINNNKDLSDIPLIGNPQITYFSSVYRKHTHYFVHRHRMKCSDGNVLNRIDHRGDLIKSIDLEINITNDGTAGNSASMTNLGTALIDNIKLYVGSEEIEKLSGSYIEMYMELKNPRGLQTFNIIDSTKFVCKQGTMEQILSLSGGVFKAVAATAPATIDIVLPIPFSFCRDVGYAFPIFLFHLDKPLSISFEDNTNTITGLGGGSLDIKYNFIINYIGLSERERMRFKTSNNEYLHERIYEQYINTQFGENPLLIDPVGNIKSIMWGKTTAIDYKYNIEVNTYKLFNQDKLYHYFTRKTISDAGYLGGSCINNSTTNVKHDDLIGFYSFALKDYNQEDLLAPTGSISSSANKIYFIVNNYNNKVTEKIIVYIKAFLVCFTPHIFVVFETFIKYWVVITIIMYAAVSNFPHNIHSRALYVSVLYHLIII